MVPRFADRFFIVLVFEGSSNTVTTIAVHTPPPLRGPTTMKLRTLELFCGFPKEFNMYSGFSLLTAMSIEILIFPYTCALRDSV